LDDFTNVLEGTQVTHAAYASDGLQRMVSIDQTFNEGEPKYSGNSSAIDEQIYSSGNDFED